MSSSPPGPIFVHPQDATEPIFWLIPAVIAVVGIGVCVVGLVRGRLPERWSAAALVSLPVTAFVLASLVLMERSKATEFCASCHVMTPVLASVYEENGSLASIHVRRGAVRTGTSCYGCHSGYGIWGDAGAKMSGVQHMVHTVMGSYELPLKLYGSYDINGCLQCHAESASFRGVEVHSSEGIAEALLAREMSCTGMCHPAAHPPEALSGQGMVP